MVVGQDIEGLRNMFDTHFDVLLCDTPESQEWHYRLRYDVYCIDREYENAAAFPDRLERDTHDAESVHFLVRNRLNGQFVASMRLVVGRPTDLPFWHHCQLDNPQALASLGKVAEISRLSIIPAYRHWRLRAADVSWKDDSRRDVETGSVVQLRERRYPHILVGLLRAGYHYSFANGIDHWFALQSDTLSHILLGLGFHMDSAGPEQDYRGVRRPYLADLSQFLSGVESKSPQTHDFFLRQPAYSRFSDESYDLVSQG